MVASTGGGLFVEPGKAQGNRAFLGIFGTAELEEAHRERTDEDRSHAWPPLGGLVGRVDKDPDPPVGRNRGPLAPELRRDETTPWAIPLVVP
jgi:hypothetical protein